MALNALTDLQTSFYSFLQKRFNLALSDLHPIELMLNTDEKKQAFGDLSSNAALVLAKLHQQNPRLIAQTIIDEFSFPTIARIELAGPGFLNIFLTSHAFQDIAHQLFEQPFDSFRLTENEPTYRYSVEFVSANPTGPLHIGHGRGGIIGDVLSRVLTFLGHSVTKEFYINDAGSQIEKLGHSFKARVQQALGLEATVPEDGYQGEYLQDLAQQCIQQYGSAVLEKKDSFFADYAKTSLLAQIKQTLHDYGITFDLWFSEKTLHHGSINKALAYLIAHDLTYEKDDALWFKSTMFGDDKDRVLRKSNGELTYLAADVAYTENKLERADRLVLILGQDHHSYKVRLEGIVHALGHNKDILDVILYQLVTIKQTGQNIRLSKRAGRIVTLRELIDTVGKDVARFFYLNRKADAHLDFDLDLALKHSDENPVYYVQYAYVRTKSILERANQYPHLTDIKKTDFIDLQPFDVLLIKKIASLSTLLRTIARGSQTHLLTYYVIELAQLLHQYYSKHRVIDEDNSELSRSRLALITLVKNSFELCLSLLGISAPEKM